MLLLDHFHLPYGSCSLTGSLNASSILIPLLILLYTVVGFFPLSIALFLTLSLFIPQPSPF